jgi:hypothetical protein
VHLRASVVEIAYFLDLKRCGWGEDEVACWFIDTGYDSFFVRHAYFLGRKDPYRKLKADVDEEARASLYSKQSRPFAPPAPGRAAVKVINQSGDEAMRVFKDVGMIGRAAGGASSRHLAPKAACPRTVPCMLSLHDIHA